MLQTLDPLTGIATGVRLIPRPPGGPRIFNATMRMADTTGYLGVQANDRNGGAALDEEGARSAALCEGIERYCAAAIDPSSIVTADVNALIAAGEDPVTPEETALFDVSQHDALPFAVFRRDTRLSWLRGVSLVTGEPRLVPASLVHLPYRPVDRSEVTIGPSISTGLACADSHLGAVLSGLLECVERDAFAIVWRNQLAVPRLDLTGSALSEIFETHFRSPRLEMHLFLATLDHTVPTVIAIVEDRNFDPPVFCLGGASRASVAEAAMKALIEGAQGWTWARHERLLAGPRPVPEDFSEIVSFEERVKLYACSDMRPALRFLLDRKAAVRLSDLGDRPPEPDHATLSRILGEPSLSGSDAIAVELTTPEIAGLGLSVVKVFCPAFEQVEGDHRFQLLGGQRWRTAPVACGLRIESISPADANPYPHPYP